MRPALLLLLLAGCATAPAGSGVFLAGFAAADITPPVGWRRAGGYHELISTGVHDPLYAKAVVFEQGGVRGALVVCDLCSIGRDVSDPVRRLASARTGIPFEHISISATHTHGGPEFHGVLWEAWRDATVAKHGSDIHAKEDYVRKLVEACAGAVARADAAKRPVSLESGEARAPGIAFNRRHHLSDGTTTTNPGKKNPKILRAAGPVNDALPWLLARDLSGTPVGSFTAFDMHVAVFGGPAFGADFPAHLQERLRGTHGRDFISIFAEGCAGDVNHVDVSSERPQPGETEPARIGGALADALLKAEPRRVQPSLAVRSTRVRVPLREVTPEETARARDVLSLRLVPNPGFFVLVGAYRILWTEKLRARDGESADEEIQAFRISDEVAIVTLPHEIFVEIGMAIRERSPFRRTIVVSLANDVDFYVPTRKAFAEGGYEVETSPYKPGGGELLVDAAVRLLRSLR
jgi:hypothetical protein